MFKFIKEPKYTKHNQKLFPEHKEFLKKTFSSHILRNATYKQRTGYLKW